MITKFKFSSNLVSSQDILTILRNFSSTGTLFGNGDRNKIKLYEVNGLQLNVKSFKIPNIINKVAYKYFRKSKARRSYEYATILIQKNVGTPEPIAFMENFSGIGLQDSYYVSQHMVTDLTYRELVENRDYPDGEVILRQFTKFTFELHEKGIEFLDHSPGNTLIKKEASGNYSFYLVDLNRMNFHEKMNFEQRMQNFSRLTPHIEMIKVMSNEYAKMYGLKSESEIELAMWAATNNFQEGFARKKRIKKRLKFWKS